jgi:hypothetical protein
LRQISQDFLPFPIQAYMYLYLCVCVCVCVSGVWTQVLFLLVKHYITWVTPLALLALVIFQVGSCSYAQVCLDLSPSIYTSHAAESIVVYCHTQIFIGRDGVLLTFCQDWSQTLIPLISTSRVARITGVSHPAWPHPYFLHLSVLCSIHCSSHHDSSD